MYIFIALVWIGLGIFTIHADRAFEETAVSFLVAAVFFLLSEVSAFRIKAEKKWEDEANGRIPESDRFSKGKRD